MMRISKLLITALIFTFIHTSVNGDNDCYVDDDCIHKETRESGKAKLVYQCPAAIEDLKKGKLPSACGYQGHVQIVCCPTPQTVSVNPVNSEDRFSTANRNERKSLKKCREYAEYIFENITLPISIPGAPEVVRRVDRCGHKVIPLIVGGTLAKSKEFPHMVLVGYSENPILWKCGGTLISEKFVLTAGHCLESREYGSAKWIRVGELNYETEEDDARPVDVKIKRHVPHPEYTRKTQYNDIALLELEQSVTLNPYVVPACLFPNYDTRTEKAIASGWGRVEWAGETSSNLLKVTLELFTHEECNKTFEYNINRKLSKGIVDESQICAGSHTEEKDTCEGDSGGPLQIYNKEIYCMYNIIGITSFGKGCGSVGQPGVYTRVSNYIDWIENETWPDQ